MVYSRRFLFQIAEMRENVALFYEAWHTRLECKLFTAESTKLKQWMQQIHSSTSNVTALWVWNSQLKGFLGQMSTFRKRNYGWSASCTVWQFQRHIGALKYRNKIEKRRPEKKPTTLISQKVTHPSSNPSKQSLTSVTSKSTWQSPMRLQWRRNWPEMCTWSAYASHV